MFLWCNKIMKNKLQIVFILIYSFIVINSAYSEYWKRVTNLPPAGQDVQWLDIFFVDANHGWVCGRGLSGGTTGRVARTIDGGTTWNVSIVSGWFLESIHFIDQYNGFCSGPSGVFKTNDGGITWNDVPYLNNLISLGVIDIWGCFMLSTDTIYVAGGGCSPPHPLHRPYGSRIIWRSTDGGSNWTANVLDNKPLPSGVVNYLSGLTDVMMYKNGIGYASSSGLIWKTIDWGDNWTVWSQTGSNFTWQEEITNIPATNTVLVPFSGVDCAGGGNTGGMLFTSDGINWRKQNTPGSMFGTFLISQTEGWACGTGCGVYQTKNAGITWTLKNCGILASDNLDDIFFLNANTGWVVGDNIYKLAPSEITVSKDTVDFGMRCNKQEIYDTLMIYNKTFNNSALEIQILKENVNFKIVEPASTNSTIKSCSETKLIVKFTPQNSYGLQDFKIVVKVNPENEQYEFKDTIYYKAIIKDATVRTDIDTIDLGNIPVQTYKHGIVKWTSQETDTLISYTSNQSDPKLSSVNVKQDSSFIISANARNMTFTANPLDTGMYVIKYSFIINPCHQVKNVILKFKGISPVITAKNDYTIEIDCKEDTTIKIPIMNVGNDTLTIFNVEIEDIKNVSKILGFSATHKQPIIKIAPKEMDTLYLSATSIISDSTKATIKINNDDNRRSTSIHPYTINLNTIFRKAAVDKQQQTVYFGDLCVGSRASKEIKITNTGKLALKLSKPQPKLDVFIFNNSTVPTSAKVNETVTYNVDFYPTKAGLFIDTVKIKSQPCNVEYSFILIGRGVLNKIQVNPEEIKDKINIGETKKYQIKIKSLSPQTIKIDSINMIPAIITEADIKILTPLQFELKENEEKTIEFSAFSKKETKVRFNLKVYYSSSCYDSLLIPVEIEFIDNKITYTDKMDNPVYKFKHSSVCDNIKIFDTIYVNNTQSYIFKSLQLSTISPDYKIETNLNLPKQIAANSKIEIVVSFTPTVEGNYDATLIFEMFSNVTNETQFDSLYFKNTYSKTNTFIKNNLFDFGLFELCEKPIEKTLTIVNNGTLEDTCDIDTSGLTKCISLSTTTAVVPALDSVEIKIICNPELAENKTKFTGNLKIKTRVCPKEMDVELKYQTDEIALDVTPQLIDFGTVWINDNKNDTITITNPSIFDLQIEDISLLPSDYFKHSTDVPFILKSNESKKIPITFSSNVSGNYKATANITAKRYCEIQKKILFDAFVPEEMYPVTVKWSKVRAVPGELSVIEATVEHTAPQLAPSQIDFYIKMDYALFEPQQLFFIDENNNEKPLSFIRDYPHGITSSLSNEDAKTALNFEKVFLKMQGIALLSNPKVTPIDFDKFDIKTNKMFNLSKITGEFEIYGFCEANGYRTSLKFLPIFETTIKENIVTDKKLKIDFNATGEIDVFVEIIDLLGTKIYADNVHLEKGTKQHSINLDIFTAGTYFVRFSSAYYPSLNKQIIILK